MKKFILLIITTLTLLSQSGCGLILIDAILNDDDSQTSSTSTQQEVQESTATSAPTATPIPDSVKDFGNCKIEILDANLAEIGNKPVIIVNYNFTNNDKQPKAFVWSVEDSAFQDGIGLDSVIVSLDEDVYDVSLASREIQQGVSYVVTRAYFLNNTSSPVNVEVVKYLNLSDNPKKATKQFVINE